jgi:hypothetical protein
LRQPIPHGLNDPADLVQLYLTIDHVTEQTFPIPCAHRDVICPSLRIIIILQTNRSTFPFLVDWILRDCRHARSVTGFDFHLAYCWASPVTDYGAGFVSIRMP